MKHIIQFFAVLVLSILSITGCSKLDGKWAYNYDPETVILELNNKGNAVYKGQSYHYQSKGQFIELTSEEGETTKLRYRIDGDKLYLYEHSVYDYQGNGNVTRLPGFWKSGNSSFEFNEQGQFMEDGVFSGIYSIAPKEGTFTLHYNESFADTTCYYQLSENHLYLEYPWQMVKVK